MGAAGIWFEDALETGTNWLVERIGFAGLCLIMLVSDTLVTPFPPDLLLVVIARSQLAERWFLYVFVLGAISVCAGMLGWRVGRYLGNFPYVKYVYTQTNEEMRVFVQRYGFWAVVLGATTPLPYSITCWTAGIMGVRGKTVFAASVLFRIPRMFFYYLLIESSGNLFGL